MAKQKVLVLSMGGTLGMRPVDGGPLKPDKVLNDLEQWLPELHEVADLTVEIITDVDSSFVTPDLWLVLARRIEAAMEQKAFRGIIVLHGTDTMAYTASALSFLLPALNLPLVLTGGQKPLASTRTDARNNIIGAVESALEGPNELMVYFNNKAFRGNRVTKVAIGDFDGFNSPNYPVLGQAGITWHWEKKRFWPSTRRPAIWPAIPDSLPPTPWVLPWVPGQDFERVYPAFENHWAVVLEAFGTGNIPVTEQMLRLLKQYIGKGGLVFLKSQVLSGEVFLGAYEPGKRLQDVGVLGAGDMTREALVSKLMILAGVGMKDSRLKAQMGRSLVGELTEREN